MTKIPQTNDGRHPPGYRPILYCITNAIKMRTLPFEGVFKNKKILITGNTGFKGSWLTLWFSLLEARVYGYALGPPTQPSLFEDLHLEKLAVQEEADVLDFERLKATINRVQPDIIFHLAAQSLLGESYDHPLETIQVNTMGSLHVMEAVRQLGIRTALVMVTSDKCYENKEWVHGYRETDPLGGYDPYSASKGAAEILIASWRNSFFPPDQISRHGVRLASVRAGNVIGGGDWAKDRIVPDCIRNLSQGDVISVRNPLATRPWQHVLEPLHGYMQLGAALLDSSRTDLGQFCDAFNFGPQVSSNKTVEQLVGAIIQHWGSGSWAESTPGAIHHEASLLNLSIDKAYHQLGWLPRWDFETTVHNTVEWYALWNQASPELFDFTIEQIQSYEDEKIFPAASAWQKENQPQL